MASAEELRSQLHKMWAGVASAWDEHADFIDTREEGVTEKMLDLAGPKAGERVLELACGPGGVGLAAARRVGPDGEVVLSDVAAEMTAIAARRAERLGLDNVITRELDIENIDEPDESYDVVLSRAGLMFATDPSRALANIRRVLRAGGRVAVVVWGPRERNPWIGILMDSVSEQLGAPVPPPGIPGPFALSDAEGLRNMIRESDLEDAEVTTLDVPLRVASFDEWWRRAVALAGPLAKVIESLPGETLSAIRERADQAASHHRTADGLVFPGVALLASARRQ